MGLKTIRGACVFGSMLWKAWPQNTYMLKSFKDKSRQWSASEPRRWNAIKDNPIKLTMVENSEYTREYPLLFVRYEEDIDPGTALIREFLRIHGPPSQGDLEDLQKRPHPSIVMLTQARLHKRYVVKPGRPARSYVTI